MTWLITRAGVVHFSETACKSTSCRMASVSCGSSTSREPVYLKSNPLLASPNADADEADCRRPPEPIHPTHTYCGQPSSREVVPKSEGTGCWGFPFCAVS
jgi:hypothetical protein